MPPAFRSVHQENEIKQPARKGLLVDFSAASFILLDAICNRKLSLLVQT